MPSEKASKKGRGESGSPSKSRGTGGRKRKEKVDKVRDAVPHPVSVWLGGMCACTEVVCGKKEQIGRKEKKEKKSKRSKDKEKKVDGDSAETQAPDAGGDDDGNSAGSGDTCTSYATESCMSSRGDQSARSCADDDDDDGAQSSRSRGREKSGKKKPTQSKDEGGVRVLSLADIKGQELPAEALNHGSRSRGDESARSGRSGRGRDRDRDDDAQSEGGRSARSCRSDAQSEGGRSVASVSVKKYMNYLSEPKSPAEVKKMVKDFVRQMVKGRDMGVLRADGVLKPVLCRLARELDTLKIKAGDQTRKVPLGQVERVLHGSEELGDLETPLDECCSTLELANDGECISFKFPERKAAELFTLCMQLFIDGQKPQ